MRLPSFLTHVCLLFMLAAAPVAVGTPARVALVDGRVVEGELDDATDEHHLWLRRGDDRVLLSTSYRWNEVASVEIDGQVVTSKQILDQSADYVAAWPEYFLFAQDESHRAHSATCDEPIGRLPRAVSTSFVAELANWDGDVEPDGYEIAVTVFDELGQPMAVRGTLAARLEGERGDRRGVPMVPVELERWTNRIDLDQFANGPAVFRLPFRQIDPEVELDIEPGGILEVEVGAFGYGRMAASRAVPIRAFNPIRDRYELSTGSRFFPGERHEYWNHGQPNVMVYP